MLRRGVDEDTLREVDSMADVAFRRWLSEGDGDYLQDTAWAVQDICPSPTPDEAPLAVLILFWSYTLDVSFLVAGATLVEQGVGHACRATIAERLVFADMPTDVEFDKVQ